MRFYLFGLGMLLPFAMVAQVNYKTVPVPSPGAKPFKKAAPMNMAARQPHSVVDVVFNSAAMKSFAQLMRNTDSQMYRNGVYTIFGPSDSAMAKLPLNIAANLRKPENKATTEAIIKYHVLPGKLSESDIVNAIKKANGYAAFITVAGKKVVFSMTGNYVKITDEEGHVANVRFSHYNATNGMVHVIDKVLMPKD